ncbi:LLM class F420-dependent oxidoreductase [Pseudonocardia xishanensis]|uniref:LLM class F420-dependent oxidoreductase n=1 Tax=Pseudonocardia xishanensis TaxID=630995 RepID=A0ABP8RRX0_9PSEU
MELGLHVGYWSAGPPPTAAEAVIAAERLGFESVWTAEAYGSDCLTPLAWWGSATDWITLGTNILQMAARTPTATAMAALTLDHLSAGRFVLGLGASGPQVVEGWYGSAYPRPLARTREYVDIVRKVWARDKPVSFDGDFYTLPYPGGAGLGKALKSTVHPLRTDIPIHLAAEGPKNVALAAEIADGWLPLFFSPRADGFYREALAEGFDRPGARRTPADFQVSATVPVIVDDDVERAADRVRPMLALYIGGMGAKEANFHNQVFVRLGYEEACVRIQELFLNGQRQDAAAAVPTALVEDVALVGPAGKVREELARWEQTVVDTLIVSGGPDSLEAIARVVRG